MGFTQVWQPVAYKHGCNTLALSRCGVSEHDYCLAVSLMEMVQSDGGLNGPVALSRVRCSSLLPEH